MSNTVKFVVYSQNWFLDKIIEEKDLEKLYCYIEEASLRKEDMNKIINFAMNDPIVLYYIIANFNFDDEIRDQIIDMIAGNKYFNYLSDFIVISYLRCKFNEGQINRMIDVLIENNHISERLIDTCKEKDFNKSYRDRIIDYLFSCEDFYQLRWFIYDEVDLDDENRIKFIDKLIENKGEMSIRVLSNLVMCHHNDINDELEKKIIDFFINEKLLKYLFLFISEDLIKDNQQKSVAKSLILDALDK